MPRELVRRQDKEAEPFLRASIDWYPEASGLLARVRAGDTDAAFEAALTFPNAARGRFVGWCYALGLPKPALRAALSMAWDHDHAHVFRAAGTVARLGRWFRQAEFDVSHLPDPVTVWRGTSHLSWFQAASGVSWTTKREVACWFAMWRPGPDPLVLRRTVPRQHVLYYSDGRQESEAVITEAHRTETDGTVEDWRAVAERVQADRSVRLIASLAASRSGAVSPPGSSA